MDVVPDRDLLNFIEILNVEEKKVVDISQVSDVKDFDKAEKEEETADVWQDIATTALENWHNEYWIKKFVILNRKIFDKQSKNR